MTAEQPAIAEYVLHYGPASRVESAWCEWNGQRFDARSSHGALCALARVLVAADAPDGPWRSLTMAGTPSLRGPSLHELARLTIEEGEKAPRFHRYKERPYGITSNLVGGDGKEADARREGYVDAPEAPSRFPASTVSAETALPEAAAA